MCATCIGVPDTERCSYFSTCNDTEVCHMVAYQNEAGQTLHDYGCAHPRVCPLSGGPSLVGRSSNIVHHDLCNVCCNDTHVCNIQLTCVTSGPAPSYLPEECSDLRLTTKTNGTYTIYPYGASQLPVSVYCVFDSDGNVWTVIQRRFNGSVNFYRNWDSYKNGFGSPFGEYWLGNDVIHQLTSNRHHSLRVVISDFDGVISYADYTTIQVASEVHLYELYLSGYSGNAGDSFVPINGLNFTTFDRDNDKSFLNCARSRQGGWWYQSCAVSNLNGLYRAGQYTSPADGMYWSSLLGYYYSLKTTMLMIRKT